MDARKKQGWAGMLRFVIILFVAAVALRSLVVAPFSIPSGSMLPALRMGDYLFVAKWRYGYSRHSFPFSIAGFDGRLAERLPERGDIAVFRYPGAEGGDFVKRIIGLPGDRIEVRGGTVRLNGAALPQVRVADFEMPVSPNSPCRKIDAADLVHAGVGICAYPRYRETLPDGRSYFVLDQTRNGPGDAVPPLMVPEGHVFVLGDNRDDSLDSRFSIAEGGVGLVPVENLQGPALITFFSTDGSAEWLKPWTWAIAARWDRIGRTFP